jgi:hypothetical protein
MAKGNPNWTNGISGNPNGRPKDELGILIRKQKGLPKKLFNAVITITKSANETNKLKAIEFLADRGWGKPSQMVALTNPDGKNLSISVKVIECK